MQAAVHVQAYPHARVMRYACVIIGAMNIDIGGADLAACWDQNLSHCFNWSRMSRKQGKGVADRSQC